MMTLGGEAAGSRAVLQMLGSDNGMDRSQLSLIENSDSTESSNSGDTTSVHTDHPVNLRNLGKYQQNNQCPFIMQVGFIDEFSGPSIDNALW